MANKKALREAKQKRGGGLFVALPFDVIRSVSFTKLSPHAIKLLFDLLQQYNLNNNGDLCAAWTVMKRRGWKSQDTLNKAKKELLTEGWIEVARQGGRHKASLYAVTFFAIDECGGKLDIKPTRSPPGTWQKNEPLPPIKLHAVIREKDQSSPNCIDECSNLIAA